MRRHYVGVLMGLAKELHRNGMMMDCPTWRIAASIYKLCRLGLAEVRHEDFECYSLHLPSGMQFLHVGKLH
jgi:hypothetical protein